MWIYGFRVGGLGLQRPQGSGIPSTGPPISRGNLKHDLPGKCAMCLPKPRTRSVAFTWEEPTNWIPSISPYRALYIPRRCSYYAGDLTVITLWGYGL